jgi:prolyl-tRNA synthetase
LKAKGQRDHRIKKIDSKEEFYTYFGSETQEGFALSHWSGEEEVEKQIKEDLGVTIRCIPLDGESEEGICVISGKKSRQRVIYAKAY